MATPNEKQAFSVKIEQAVQDNNISIMEAIMDYCESIGLEVELAATLLTDELKAKFESQVRGVNLLKKEPEPTKKAAKKVRKC